MVLTLTALTAIALAALGLVAWLYEVRSRRADAARRASVKGNELLPDELA